MSALERGFHTQDEVQDAQRAEAEALSRLKTVVFGPPVETELRYATVEGYAEAVRRTERVRAEAVVEATQALVDLTERWNNTDWHDEHEYAEHERECYMRIIAALAAYRESQS